MGLSFTDVTALVTRGYKIQEINEVKQLADASPEEGKNIIELAKKIGYADFKQAMQLFAPPTDDQSADQKTDDKPDNNEPDTKEDQSGTPDQGQDKDSVDYKSLYEKEKSLRESIQKSNQSRDVSDHDNKMTDEEVALSFASDCLN